jgi:hypothetical protein
LHGCTRIESAFIRRCFVSQLAIRNSKLDLLLRKLHLEAERIRQPIRQIYQTNEQVNVDDLFIREVLFQRGDIGVGNGF